MMKENAARQIGTTCPKTKWIPDAVRQRTHKPGIEIAEVTGPMNSIEGRRLLTVVDVENLTYSARELGFKVSYKMLADKLRQAARSCVLHAFFSRERGDERWGSYFAARGWIPHPNDIETVQTYQGKKRLANSDNMILFNAGLFISRSTADTIVLASGDGSMVCDIAKFLSELPKPREVVTMSLAGSTSWRLDAKKNQYISCNIELGKDCLHEYPRWR